MPPTAEQMQGRLAGVLAKADTPEQISMINSLQEAVDEQYGTSEERRSNLKEGLEFDIITADSVVSWTYLLQQVRIVMESLGLAVGDDRRRKKLCVRIFEGLFDEEEVVRAEMKVLEIVAARSPTSSGGPATEFAGPRSDSLFGISKALGCRWSENSKYSGETDDSSAGISFNFFRATYLTAMNELNVLQLADALVMLEDKFLNESTKMAIRSKLVGLRLSDIEKSHELTEIEALEKAESIIFNLSQSGHQEYRTDAAMIDVMERHVLQKEAWSADVAIRRATQHFTFQGYCAALVSWLRVAIEKGDKRLGDLRGATPLRGTASQSLSHALVNFGEHYSGPRSVKKTFTGNRKGALKAMRKGTCHRCGEYEHYMSQCPKKGVRTHLDALKARVHEAGNGPHATARVLYEVGLEMDALQKDRESQEADFAIRNVSEVAQVEPHGVTNQDSIGEEYSSFFLSGDPQNNDDAKDEQIFALCSDDEADSVHFVSDTLSEVLKASFFPGVEDSIATGTSAFRGAALDTGAQRSVIGFKQAAAYSELAGTLPLPSRSNRKFKLGDEIFSILGVLQIVIPTPSGQISFYVDIVQTDVPLLIGLDVLDRLRLEVLSVSNFLKHVPADRKQEGWCLPLKRLNGHAYLAWDPAPSDVHFSRQELEKIHRHLYHASTDKTLELQRRASQGPLPEGTRKVLEDIASKCHPCQVNANAPSSFSIRLPSRIVFNAEVRLDLMFLDKRRPVLHVLDAGTNFQAAVFTPAEDSSTVWNSFLTIWVHALAGFPQNILVDQGSVFVSSEFKYLCASNEVVVRATGVESHQSLGAAETYHHMVRRVYEKIRFMNTIAPQEVALGAAVHALNSTAGPKGLIPALLVFGMIPKIPSPVTTPFRENSERMKILGDARKEYEAIVARTRVQLGLKTRPPSSTRQAYRAGDYVYVYREKQKVWTGPFQVLSVADKDVVINTGSPLGPQHFNVWQIKPCLLGNSHEASDRSTSQNEDGKTPKSAVLWTEAISAGDPRATSSQMKRAIHTEMKGLIDRGTFSLVTLPSTRGLNIVPTKLVLTVKHEEGGPRYKARFCVGGHRDKMKSMMLHTASPLSRRSLRVLLAVASARSWNVWSVDVDQAYLQSSSKLKKQVFCKTKALKLKDEEYLKVNLPLYGLAESGDYWSETLRNYYSEIGFHQSVIDPSLFYKQEGGASRSVSGAYVDDILFCAPDDEWDLFQSGLQARFQCKTPAKVPFSFLGLQIEALGTSSGYRTHMSPYILRLQELKTGCSFSEYRTLRAKLLWACNARPDISAFVSYASSIMERTFTEQHRRAINRRVKHLKETHNMSLKFPTLATSTLHLVVYSDASFGSRDDKASQIGYLILLADQSMRCEILDWNSSRSRRVARSSLTAESLAFAQAFDAAHSLRHTLRVLLGRNLPVIMMTDSAGLFDIVSRQRAPSESRLMIDLHAAIEAYQMGDIANLALIRSQYNAADALTKCPGNDALYRLMSMSRIAHPVTQYIATPLERTQQPGI